MDYPNKIYVAEYTGPNVFGGKSHFVIVVAASSQDVAKEHVKQKIGLCNDHPLLDGGDERMTWLMNGVYPTMYCQKGEKPLTIQAKILYNGSNHLEKKDLEVSI